MANAIVPVPARHFEGGGNLATGEKRQLDSILNAIIAGLNKSVTSDEVPAKIVVLSQDAEGAPTADSRNIRCQIQTLAGVPIAAARNVKIRALAPTSGQGTLAVATATPKGTLRKVNNAATGENVLTMAVDPADGIFAFALGNTQAASQVDVEVVGEGCLPVLFSVAFA